jgi:hypothetical protein
MSRPTDYRLDPPEEPETTLTEDLINAVDAMLMHCKERGALLRLGSLAWFVNRLADVREQMTADDLPEYDVPVETDPAQVREWVNLHTDASDDERKAMEEDEGNG